MYAPRSFTETDTARLHALIEAHAFGLLVAADPRSASGVELTHVPFLLDRQNGAHGRLRLHVARENPIAKAALEGAPVTAVFQGPHGYVSPRWYEEPTRQVPTWNYAVVHAHGVATRMDGEELLQLVAELSAVHEGGAEAPWTLDQLPHELVEGLLGGIVGLSIPIARLEGKLKLSQNRSEADRLRVRRALAERDTPDDRAMVALMRDVSALPSPG